MTRRKSSKSASARRKVGLAARIPWRRLAVPLAVLLVSAAIWIGATHIVRVQREILVESAMRENRNRVVAFSHFVEAVLARAEARSSRLAAVFAPRLEGPAAGEIRGFNAIDAWSTLFRGAEIADATGRVRWSSLATPRTSIAGTPLFRMARANPRMPAVVAMEPAEAGSGKPMVGYGKPILRADGSLAGVVVLRFPVDEITRFYEGAEFMPNDLVSVIGLRDGMTLARREGGVVSHGQDLSGTLVMRRQRAAPNGTYVGPSAIDGVVRIFSHRRLPRYGVFVTVGQGMDQVLAPSHRRARIFYATVGALTLALIAAAGLSWLAARRRERVIHDLAATNARLRDAQRIGKIGDWQLDVASDTLICSAEACRMHGRNPEDKRVPGAEALGYYQAEAAAEVRATVRRTIVTRQPQQCEVAAPLDGGERYLRIRMSPVTDEDGFVHTVIGTEQDITTERRHDALRAEVAHIARVEAVNVMAATIAHELAQPLTAAGNFLSTAAYLTKRRSGAELDREQLSGLLAQTKGQIGLAKTIIARARDMVSDRTSNEVTSLDEVVADAVTLSRAADPAVSRVQVTVELQPDTGHVAADRVQIQQVLLNLLRNAAQALAEVAEPRVLVSSRREANGMVMMCVSDNGAGFPPGGRDPFTPFGAERRNGLGLGLSICRAIVESYGGRIWSETSSLGGAAICFTLPSDELAALFAIP